MTTTELAKIKMIEKKIISRFIADALDAGFTLSVHNGEKVVVRKSVDKNLILCELWSVDEEAILCHKDGKTYCLELVHGNGRDVIHNWSLTIEPLALAAVAVGEKY